ncbi:MAG: hypothetical protein J6R42_00090 [Clostridia bacterium]|nr:hypothetical protein [Clostridia bacterium]
MQFFKRNSYEITKLFIYQIGMTMLGLILTFATSMYQQDQTSTLTLLSGIFVALFYLYLIYVAMWDIGARDKIRIDAGRQVNDPTLGLKLMLYAQVPNFFFALMIWLGAICLKIGGSFGGSLGGLLYGIGQPIALFTQGMYFGIICQFFQKEALFIVALTFTLTPIPALLASYIGYLFGLRDVRFLTSPYKPKS